MPGKTVLLYGNSILIAGLASKLQDVPGLVVEQWQDEDSADLERLKNSATPDLIVADLRDAKTSQALSTLCSLPGVTLVGLDALTNTLTTLTGQSQPARSIQEVLDLLKEAL
jgi:hypothetical protein